MSRYGLFCCVRVGGMSNNPVDIPLELLTEKQLQLRGFWIAKWIRDHSKEERAEMVNHLLEEIKDQQLGFFMQVHDFDDFSWALEKAQVQWRPNHSACRIIS